MNDVFERLRATAPAALDETPVVFAYLFGSTATGRTHPESDVDVAVYVDPVAGIEPDVDLCLDLAGRLSDASGVGRIEVVALNSAPLPLKGRIVRERKVLYSRDEPARVAFESLTLRMFFDFQIHAEELDRELLRAIAEGRR